MVLIWLIVAVVAALFYYFIVKPYSYWRDRGVKQGRPMWILGDNWKQFFKIHSPSDMVKDMYDQCPGTRYSGVYQLLTPNLLLKDPDLLKQITVKDFDYFTDHKSFIPGNSDPIWGRNLFALKGQPWREMRTILSPSFTSSKMRAMFVLMDECAENFVQHFLKKNEDVISLEMKDVFTRFANDIIASTAFGVKIDSLAEPNNEFYLMGKKITNFSGFWTTMKLLSYMIAPKLFDLLQIKFFDKHVTKFFTQLTSDTIKIREEKGIVRPDMIHLLMEARKGIQRQEEKDSTIDAGFATAEDSDLGNGKVIKELTDMDIAAQGLVFFFAGFDSVSTLMCFVGHELAVHKDMQDRLREEVHATSKECGGKLTYEGLLKMRYMDMVVSETLRKWPNALVIDRVCTKPYVIEPVTPDEKPVYLEKGAVLWLPVYGIHRDPQNYPDPERFDPERFNDENKANIKPYTYLPFGLGPRNCIGSRFALLETKALFFYILKHFEFVPIEKTAIPLKMSKSSFIVNAEGGFWIGLKRLKK